MRNVSTIYVILVLWVAGLCAAAQFAKMALVLPELQQLYPQAGTASGFLITLISLVGALFGLVAGVVVAKIGPRGVLLTGLVVGTMASLIQSVSLPLGVLLVTRIIEGASHLAIVVAAPTLIARVSSDRMRASAMTLWGTFFGVSFALTAWLGLPLAQTHGVHSLFLAHSMIMGTTTLIAFWLVPKKEVMANNDTIENNSFSIARLFERHKQAWSSPYIAAPAAGWLFYTITFVALLATLPNQVPEQLRAFVAAAMPLASIASSMTVGVALLWRYSAIQVVIIGFVLSIFCALLFFTNTNTVLVCLLLFTALGLVQGASFAAIPQLNTSSAHQALSNGAQAQAGNIGNLCGTPLLLLLLSYGGMRAMIATVIVCYLVAIFLHAYFARQRAKAVVNK